MKADCTVPSGLDALEKRLAQDLAWLELPAKSWVPPREVEGQRVRDVVIIGAGMAGLVASGLLKRLGVDNHVLLDRAPAGPRALGSPMRECAPCARRSSSPGRRWACRR